MLSNYCRALAPYLRHPTHVVRNIKWRFLGRLSNERHIFVVGAPRSGTTLMQTILAAHSRLCSSQGESGLFTWQDIFDENRIFFGLDAQQQEALLEETEGLADFFDRAAGLICDIKKSDRFVEKTPQHVLYLSSIRKYFPKAAIIHMQRDGRDCFCSARRASIPHGENVERFARYWRRCIKARQEWESKRHILDVRYETLTDEPKATLDNVMAFLSEEFEPQQLSVESRAQDKRASIGRFSKLSRPIDSSSQGRWREELTAKKIDAFQQIAGEQLQQIGYPLQ